MNERTLIAALLPPQAVAGHKVPTISYSEPDQWFYLVWLAVANSFTMDFLVRRKVSLTMSYTVLDSLPFPRLEVTDPRFKALASLALRLTCTAPEMDDFYDYAAPLVGLPSGAAKDAVCLRGDEERATARAKIEAMVALQCFQLTRKELGFIMDTFPIVRRKDEAAHGEYRTKRVILEIYDEMAIAARTGTPYQTRLDPPPADPRVAHPPRAQDPAEA
jgi:hypothetical protein